MCRGHRARERARAAGAPTPPPTPQTPTHRAVAAALQKVAQLLVGAHPSHVWQDFDSWRGLLGGLHVAGDEQWRRCVCVRAAALPTRPRTPGRPPCASTRPPQPPATLVPASAQRWGGQTGGRGDQSRRAARASCLPSRSNELDTRAPSQRGGLRGVSSAWHCLLRQALNPAIAAHRATPAAPVNPHCRQQFVQHPPRQRDGICTGSLARRRPMLHRSCRSPRRSRAL